MTKPSQPPRGMSALGRHPGRRVAVVTVMAIAVVAGSWSPISIGSAPPAQAASTSVVRRYAPVVRLAKGEPWRPMSAASFIDDSSLRWSHDADCPDHEEAARGEIDDGRLGSGGYSHPAADRLTSKDGVVGEQVEGGEGTDACTVDPGDETTGCTP